MPQNAAAASKVSSVQPYSIASCIQPPTNVDLTTLSQQDLYRYGLPMKPTGDAAAVKAWHEIVSSTHQRVCKGITGARSGKAKRILGSDSGRANIIQEVNYAGNMAAASGDHYHAISAKFSLPATNSPSSALASPWVGLGQNTIVRSGIDLFSYNAHNLGGCPSSPNNHYLMWTESYPAQGSPIYGCYYPRQGDTIMAYDDTYRYNFGSGNQDVAYMDVVDQSTGVSWSNYAVGAQYLENHGDDAHNDRQPTAEWIVERSCDPSTGCSDNDGFGDLWSNFANFSQLTFTSTKVGHDNISQNVGQTYHVDNVLCTYSGSPFDNAPLCTYGSGSGGWYQLANTNAISGGGSSFSVSWLRLGS